MPAVDLKGMRAVQICKAIEIPSASERPLRLSELNGEVTTVEQELFFLTDLKLARKNPAQRLAVAIFRQPLITEIEKEKIVQHVRLLKRREQEHGPLTILERFQKGWEHRMHYTPEELEARNSPAAIRLRELEQERRCMTKNAGLNKRLKALKSKRVKAYKAIRTKYPALISFGKLALGSIAKPNKQRVAMQRAIAYKLGLAALSYANALPKTERQENQVRREVVARRIETVDTRAEAVATGKKAKGILKAPQSRSAEPSPAPRAKKRVRFANE